MTQLNAYLFFNGNCRQAMEFYQSCLGGQLNVSTVGDSPMKDQMPQETHNNIIHSVLSKDGMVLMASDMLQPGEIVSGNMISLCISGGTKEELQNYFTKLSEGGKVGTPLTEMFFGTFGDLTDKFGIRWMFQADKPQG